MANNTPRLYLRTPILDEAETFLPALQSALAAGDVASLLLRLRDPDSATAEQIIRAVAAPAQSRNVAAIVEGAVDLVAGAGVDGAHVAGAGSALEDAIKRLAPNYIVGAGGLETRDEAMRAGELSADYVLFGDAARDESESAFDHLLERVRWWAELFTTPCVALAATLDEVAPLAAAGADFIMLGDFVWSDSRGPAAAVADALGRLAVGETSR